MKLSTLLLLCVCLSFVLLAFGSGTENVRRLPSASRRRRRTPNSQDYGTPKPLSSRRRFQAVNLQEDKSHSGNVDTDTGCDSHPCLNGGSCYAFQANRSRIKSEKKIADKARNKIGPCVPSPCKNGAGCNETRTSSDLPSEVVTTGFQCHCEDDYTGKFCDRPRVKDTVDVFLDTAWELTRGVCTERGYRLYVGDFNGDGRQEVLCHNTYTGSKEIYPTRPDGSLATESAWKKDMVWCNHEGAQLFIGDFNGDGRSDMMCHDINNGYKWVSLAQPGGVFLGTSWQKDMNWCTGNTDLHVADINADGRYDMLCHRSKDGYKWVSYANQDGSFTGTSWELGMGWCTGSGQLFTADFNGDRRADLLCHERNDGRKWVALATPKGTFTGTSWRSSYGTWCSREGEELYIGDFNKDKRSDMMCSDFDGNKCISFSGEDGSFKEPGSWHRDMGWCSNGDTLLIADVNGDGGDDMVCHTRQNGDTYIAFNQVPTS